MTFRVKLSKKAEQDGEAILDWLWGQDAGQTGVRWLAGMEKQIASLDSFPHRCVLAAESSRYPFEIRQMVYGRKPHVYRILFSIEGDSVLVLHIRRPGQQAVEHGKFVLTRRVTGLNFESSASSRRRDGY